MTGQSQGRRPLARLDPRLPRLRFRPGACPCLPHMSNELGVLGPERAFESAPDLAGKGGAATPGRNGDLQLATAEHRGGNEIALSRPVHHVDQRPRAAGRSRDGGINLGDTRCGDHAAPGCCQGAVPMQIIPAKTTAAPISNGARGLRRATGFRTLRGGHRAPVTGAAARRTARAPR